MSEFLPVDSNGKYFKVGHFSVIEVSAAPMVVHEHRNTEFVFVIDGSGSMGRDTTEIIQVAIPRVMTEAGYKEEDKVTLIIFASSVYSISQTIAQLRKSTICANGGTCMRNTFCELLEFFRKIHSEAPVCISVISDGEISDFKETFQAANSACPEIKMHNGPSYVGAYRIGSQADTTALAYFLQFDTSERSGISVQNFNRGGISQLADAMNENFQQILINNKLGGFVVLKSSQSTLCRVPGEPFVDSVRIRSGTTAYILASADTDLSMLTFDGHPIRLEPVELTNESNLSTLLENIFNRIKISMVGGMNQSQLGHMFEFARAIKSQLESAAEVEGQDNKMSFTTRDRIHSTIRKLTKTEKSLCGAILALENQSNVQRLSAQQKASFLQQTVGAKSGKRAAKDLGVNVDFATAFRRGIKQIVPAAQALSQTAQGNRSYLSQNTSLEIFLANEDILDHIEQIELEELMTLIGAVGMGIWINKWDLADPWQVRVQKAFAGLYLSESDLLAFLLYSKTDFVDCSSIFGGDTKINAIVPIMPQPLYELYARHGGQISNLHASFALRKTLSPISGDRIALMSAVVLCMIRTVGQNNTVSEVESDTLKSLVAQIQTDFGGYNCDRLATQLSSSDPRLYLSGVNEVTSELKPLIVMLAHPFCASLRAAEAQTKQALMAIFAFAAYQAARRWFKSPSNDRQAAVNFLLDINIDKFRASTPIGELFTPDCLFPTIESFDLDEAADRLADPLVRDWLPQIRHFLAYYRFIVGGFDQPPLVDNAFDQVKILRLFAAFEALRCEQESDRIDTATLTAKGSVPGDRSSLQANINAYRLAIFQTDFTRRMDEKRKVEAKITLDRAILHLVQMDNLSEFVQYLPAIIANRDANGHAELLGMLTGDETDVKLRAQKLAVLLTGRDCQSVRVSLVGTTAEADAVWANGNFYPLDIRRFEKFFADSASLWEDIQKLKVTYKRREYRATHGLNRHGHGETKPSYYGLGWNSMEEFVENSTPEDLAAYAKVHLNCCRHVNGKLCLPTPRRSKRKKEAKKQVKL